MIYHFFLIKTRITAVSGTLIDCFGPFYESDNYNNLIANSSEYEPDLFLPVKVLINYRKSQMWHDDISSIPSCPLVQCSTVIRFLVRFCICKNYS